MITATKSAFERNESKFARFFVDALSKDGADADKDDRVSLLEAFRYAAAETKRFYENETKLQTEHAQFDDMGMKEGVAEPDGREKQGLLARRFFLDGGMSPQLAANARTRTMALWPQYGPSSPCISAVPRAKYGLR